MTKDKELTKLQQVLLDLIENDAEFDSFDKLKIVQDFIEDQDEDGITYYTNAAWSSMNQASSSHSLESLCCFIFYIVHTVSLSGYKEEV